MSNQSVRSASCSASARGSRLEDLSSPLQPAGHQPLLLTLSGLSGRIGIFGGSFDPVHIGHIRSALQALEPGALECVIFVPTAQNPLKSARPVGNNQERLELLIAALSQNDRLFVSPTQLLGETENYTVELLRKLTRESPKATPVLIIGSDCLTSIARWREVGEISNLAEFLIIERPGYPLSEGLAGHPCLGEVPDYVAKCLASSLVLKGNVDVSSSTIRANLLDGRNLPGDVPQAVREIIEEQRLYSDRSLVSPNPRP